MDSGDTKPFESSWNLTQFLIQDIANYLKVAGENFMNGRIDKYFWNINLIKRRISPFLSEEEKTELKEKEDVIVLALSINPKDPNFTNMKLEQGYVGARRNLSSNLEAYDERVMACLNKYKLLMKPKEDKTNLM